MKTLDTKREKRKREEDDDDDSGESKEPEPEPKLPPPPVVVCKKPITRNPRSISSTTARNPRLLSSSSSPFSYRNVVLDHDREREKQKWVAVT
ncbi:hypothetical protein LOK49_LG01G03979 [Camellia lanceoleosa]|uniref:Uncharacterized protein n=1 Tax=Camellia lanceoleosa TaxID=1840588 RepID=A0ACC0J177_9ERIC|nr:hypothetical protein LOK49_LG01G03979 [Camellia lanceoleosa]